MWSLLVPLFLAGVPGTQAPPVAPDSAPVSAPASAPATVALPTVLPSPPDGAVVLAGTLERELVTSVVKAGPQPFIASVQVAPVMDDGRFRGFRLMGVAEKSPLAGSEHVRLGDIVVAVNGMSLERPDQFMAAWGKLAKAERLEVKLLRGEQLSVVRWLIQP